jgi:glycosyltransferase involved in cell wall biosynthesis
MLDSWFMSDYPPSTVSVVIGTYNGAEHIQEQLQSILEQTRQPDEIFISDDCSCDNTLIIAERTLRNISSGTRVEIARNPRRLGFRDNFMHAARRATGDYIAFCDQDDVWRADKLERCAEYFSRRDVALITHAADLIDRHGNVTGTFRQKIYETTSHPPLGYDLWSTFWGFSIVFRRELLEIADPIARFIDYIDPRERIAHDRWICFLAQMVGITVEIADCLAGYRQHGHNLFGHIPLRSATNIDELRARSTTYIAATREMLDVIENMPERTSELFPLFDRARCRQLIQAALAQLEARHDIYRSNTTTRSLVNLLRCVNDGHYRAVHDQKLRIKSIGRDLQFALLRC